MCHIPSYIIWTSYYYIIWHHVKLPRLGGLRLEYFSSSFISFASAFHGRLGSVIPRLHQIKSIGVSIDPAVPVAQILSSFTASSYDRKAV